jgi:hypothetical protein
MTSRHEAFVQEKRMRRLLLSVAITVTALTATACGDDLTGVSGELVGTYQLQSVDGLPLPYMITGPSGAIAHVDGELELNDDGTYVRTFETSTSGGLPTTTQLTGTWERVGSAVRLERSSDGNVDVDWTEYREDNDAIIVHDDDGRSWEYQR